MTSSPIGLLETNNDILGLGKVSFHLVDFRGGAGGGGGGGGGRVVFISNLSISNLFHLL